MTVDRERILDKVFQYRLESELKSADAFLAADRSDLIRGEGLNNLLKSIENKLHGLAPRKIHATKNIVLELAGNILLHSPTEGADEELLLLIRRRGAVVVWMFGSGRKSQIERLAEIINDISNFAEPPNHREQLLKRRNIEFLRKSSSPSSREHGAGGGMLTIAALSSEPLLFKPKYGDREASFALRSIV
jgi:Family of unknown function (DUF6272)